MLLGVFAIVFVQQSCTEYWQRKRTHSENVCSFSTLSVIYHAIQLISRNNFYIPISLALMGEATSNICIYSPKIERMEEKLNIFSHAQCSKCVHVEWFSF